MGNRIGGRRKSGVEERFTRPQGLYEHKDIDQKKLRKLILEAKLAPCYPGADDAAAGGGDLEECPICFLVSTRGEISPHPLTPPSLSLSLPLSPSREFRRRRLLRRECARPRVTWTEEGELRRGITDWVYWRLILFDFRVPLPRFCYWVGSSMSVHVVPDAVLEPPRTRGFSTLSHVS
jgi:hypothetical protein